MSYKDGVAEGTGYPQPPVYKTGALRVELPPPSMKIGLCGGARENPLPKPFSFLVARERGYNTNRTNDA
jgi:hypothetical protein